MQDWTFPLGHLPWASEVLVYLHITFYLVHTDCWWHLGELILLINQPLFPTYLSCIKSGVSPFNDLYSDVTMWNVTQFWVGIRLNMKLYTVKQNVQTTVLGVSLDNDLFLSLVLTFVICCLLCWDTAAAADRLWCCRRWTVSSCWGKWFKRPFIKVRGVSDSVSSDILSEKKEKDFSEIITRVGEGGGDFEGRCPDLAKTLRGGR